MINNFQVNKVLTKNIKDNKVLLAYSGGPDSTYLLEVLASYFKDKLKDRVILAYVNYHDSEYTYKEEGIVSYYTNKYHLNRYQLYVKYDKEKDHNFEEWARNIRYSFFKDICKIENISYLVVGHHKDDLVETYLLQKERKISPNIYGLVEETDFKSYKLVRPLLSLYKNDIKEYLIKNEYLFYDDITNYDQKKKRNEIRSKNSETTKKDKIVKTINKENRRLYKLYDSFSKIKKDNYLFYQKLSDEYKKRYIFFYLNFLPIQVKEKEGLLNIIYDYLKRKKQGVLQLNSKYKLIKLEKEFFISDKYNFKKYSYNIEKPGIYSLDFFKIDLTKPDLFNIKSFPITIRNNHKGDLISTNLISKDVYSFIKKQKVPIHLREIYPVLINNKKEIFYVPFYVDVKKKKIPIFFY